ncbi:MAG: glycoside hydrolase domain-containing protein [Terracidiphilus sp.]
MFVTLAVLMLLTLGSTSASGQACAAQNWTASTPNIWASDGGVKVMLNNDPATNQPTIPIYADDGAYNPWGFEQHPQPMPQLNPVWSCPSGTPVIAIAGAGRETVSFQVYLTAGLGANSALGSVNLTVSPLNGPGATITSDNTGSSGVTRYLEGYVPYTSPGPYSPGNLQSTGGMPDPLIPFYDPYDSGNPAVATPFNVQAGTTQAVWVNVTIPANQVAGSYTGTVTITGNGVGTVEIPVTLTVWNGSLPTFDAGSVNPTYADMLKTWLPFYRGNFDTAEGMPWGGPGGPPQEQALYQKYQVMGHNYDIDLQIDVDGPANSGCYPGWGSCTSFTTDGTTSSLDWTAYDAYVGPALTPGGLFSDGTTMRTFDSPLSTAGGGAWVAGGWNWTEQNGGASVPPAGMLQLVTNYATQISQHFAANHATKGWGVPELISYTFDETYNMYHSKDIGGNERIYEIISSFNQAINSSNSTQSATWDPATFPVRTFLTDAPHCQEQGDNPDFTDLACSDHINLSYPGATNSTPGYTNSWVADWTPNASLFMPGQPGPALSYGWTAPPTPLTMGTGYQYTLDLTQGVPALSTAPAPIERWTYLGGDPFTGGVGPAANGVGPRVNYWIAYKYGLDVTVPTLNNPNPPPTPGGVWIWVGDWWSGYEGGATPTSCAGSAPSPFVTASDGDDGVVFYPGNEVGCYYSANPVGAAALTSNPAVNTNCTSLGYNVCNGISGPVASIRMEEMRRGYEDYEYLYLLGKKSGRAAALAFTNSIGSDGITSWGAMNWEDVDGSWYAMGLLPIADAYTGNCTDPTPGAGGLPAGLPNGPTGAASSGPQFNYGGCPGLWSSDPGVYEAARVEMAQALGFAAASAAPSITGLSPSNGSNAGGTSVQITGTNFTGATEVQFGGVEAASFTVNSSTSITAVTPAGNGTVDVQVFTPAGGSLPNSSDQYDYSLVTVTGVSPNLGTDEGGNTVSITGTYFSSGASVMFGSTPAINVVVNSSTSITATAPAGSGSVNVTVSSLLGTSEANSSDVYSYEPPPTLASLSVSSGPIAGGTSVTITGTGFVSGMTVSFGGNLATNVVVGSSTSLTATSPAGTSMNGGIVNVLVTTVNGSSAILSADQFTYISPVAVTGLSVQTGPTSGGTQVIITGTGFTGATAVMFGGNAAASFTVNSATQITATSPAGGGTVDVTVTTPPYSSAPVYADEFSYTAAVASGGFATLPTTVVGSTSTSVNVKLTLAAATPISSITVPKAQNGMQEFTVGTVTGCTVGGAGNPSGTVCTVPITFSPQYPGIRTGALTFTNNGEVIGTAGLAGIGQGPEIAVTPGSLAMAIGGGVNAVTATPQSVTTAAIGVQSNFAALAMDGAGNLYISDNMHCLAYKVTAATNQIAVVAGNFTGAPGAITPSTTPEPAIGSNTCPTAIAVDGAGNIYLVDSNIPVNVPYNGLFPGAVEEVSAATGEIVVIAGNPASSLTATTTPQPALNVAIWAANSLATDTAGNLYISDFFNNVVDMVTPNGQIVVVAGSGGNGGGPFATSQPATSVSLNGPTGMVVDEFGNLYISDQNINLIEMVNSAGQMITVAGGGGNAPSPTPQPALGVSFNAPGGLAVDGAGDLYIADIDNEEIEQLNLAGQLVVVAGGGTTIPSATIESSLGAQLGAIQGVEVDGAGNIYIADGQTIGNGNNMIETVSTVGAPLSFPYTNVQTSSAPQSYTLTNIGNQPLVLSSVSVAADYPLQATGCTVTANSGETLASSNNCTLTYVFDPNNGGVLDEAAIVTDNNLNTTNAQQTLQLTGTATGGTLATPTVTVTLSPSSITTAEAMTATIGVSEGPGSPMVTGSVTLTGGTYTSAATQLVSGTAQINVPVGSLAAGNYSLTATYVPDAMSSSTYVNATGTAPVTVVPASFTITGSSITVVSGATTGNTSTITVTPAGWFSGTVNLTCAIAPVPANNPATCSVEPASITLNGATPITTVLTANTAGTTSALNKSNKLFWPSAGGTALALVFLFGIPARRRNWRTMLGVVLLLVAICGVVQGCGGNSSNTTPPGLYSITVTGTSGGTSSTGYVVLKVQ